MTDRRAPTLFWLYLAVVVAILAMLALGAYLRWG